MAYLIARGRGADDYWRQALPSRPVTLGRVRGALTEWAAPWDTMISALHATLAWDGRQLTVSRLPRGKNPIYFRGLPLEEFTLTGGESFVIGNTTFTLEDEAALGPGSVPDVELTCSPEELRQVRYGDADQRLEVLAALPEVIRRSPSDAELEKQVLDVLLRGISRAGAVAVVQLTGGAPEVRTRAARAPELEQVPPSRRLIAAALRSRQSVFYLWGPKSASDFTLDAAFDWALCAPLPDGPAPGWGLYAAGRSRGVPQQAGGPSEQDLLKGDLKFAEATAAIFGALRQVRELQAEQLHVRASLRVAQEIQAGFFPRSLPPVPGYELAASSRSADETGGDYYDVLPLASGRFGLAIADVCGHGLGPSLLMASLRAALRGLAFREPAPHDLLGDLNQALFEDLTPRHRFITLLYGALDPAAHQFHFANAGHGPVVLHLRPGQGAVHTLGEDEDRGFPLGILKGPYKACAPVDLAPGDLLVLGTDGVVETRRGEELFGIKRLADFVLERSGRPLREVLDELMEATTAFHEDGRPDDDLTLMLVRRQ